MIRKLSLFFAIFFLSTTLAFSDNSYAGRVMRVSFKPAGQSLGSLYIWISATGDINVGHWLKLENADLEVIKIYLSMALAAESAETQMIAYTSDPLSGTYLTINTLYVDSQ